MTEPTAAPLPELGPLYRRLLFWAGISSVKSIPACEHQCGAGHTVEGDLREAAAALAQRDGIPRPPTFPDKRFGLSEAERDNALAAWNAVANDESLRQDITHLPLCMYAVYAAGKRAGIPRDDARDATRFRWLAADGDRAKRLLNTYSGLDVTFEIDAAMTSESGEQKSGER